jgi:deoxyribodipyrimidine photo-lyase
MNKTEIAIFWFRRDLRLYDNAGLYNALKSGLQVVPLFIFDREILDQLEDKKDRRVEFIYNAVFEMHETLAKKGVAMEVHYGSPQKVFQALLKKYIIKKVYTNHDYEPYAITRDGHITQLLKSHDATFHTYKDQVIFEKQEVVKDDGKPYTVFTPYSKKWKAKLDDFYLAEYPVEKYSAAFLSQKIMPLLSLESMGFEPAGLPFPSAETRKELIAKYNITRDFPALHGTSRLGVHLRFGTISIRELAKKARALNETFLNELIWRDFYHMILSEFPRVGEGKTFKPEYEFIEWRNDEDEFKKWCEGQTGYPIVDAGMRELNETGFMHNRVRMIVASFLSKHLLIDWRWGEAYFARKLLDFDLAANNGGWQWAAGSGCDAAPYFRIFNPTLQTQRFDKDLKYIKKWVPELNDFSYPQPIVNHEFARKRCLEVYSKALKAEG